MSDTVSAEELQRERDAYTWEQARSDLAYGTPLTIFDAGRVVRALEEEDTGIHPYDALPLLMKIFGDRDPARSEKYEQMAWNIAKLIKQASRPG